MFAEGDVRERELGPLGLYPRRRCSWGDCDNYGRVMITDRHCGSVSLLRVRLTPSYNRYRQFAFASTRTLPVPPAGPTTLPPLLPTGLRRGARVWQLILCQNSRERVFRDTPGPRATGQRLEVEIQNTVRGLLWDAHRGLAGASKLRGHRGGVSGSVLCEPKTMENVVGNYVN